MSCNEKIVVLLQRVKPEIKDVIEKLNLVSPPTAIHTLQVKPFVLLCPYQLGMEPARS